MSDRELVKLLFEDIEAFEQFVEDENIFDIHEGIVQYGLSIKKFLYLDYKGEESQEIVNYILDYEFNHHIELASQEELEELGDFEYEYLPEKIREVNKLLSRKGYGLFSYPTYGDFYALFITTLEHKPQLLQVEVHEDERILYEERCIRYYD